MIFRKDLLKDKVAIVSGGATGICLDISRALLENGASVHIISRKIQNINNAVKLLKQETGNSRISGSSCDVRDEKQIEKTVTELVEAKGRIDILVNGAAGNFICPFEKLSPNAFRTVLMIDTVGTFLLSKYVNQIGFKNGGVIVNISANLHVNGTVLQSHAGTAKAGVDALTKHMAVELGPKGVRVVGISPGIIEGTEGFSRLNVGNQSSTSMSSLVPSQRLGTARDIANCTIFLCSDGASYINGQTITVDGGSHLTMANFPFFVEEFRKSYGKPKL